MPDGTLSSPLYGVMAHTAAQTVLCAMTFTCYVQATQACGDPDPHRAASLFH